MRHAQAGQRGARRRFGSDEVVRVRPCDWPDCAAAGDFRAPKSRETLRDYHWFCLEHVRAYNAEWNYFDGLDAGQIEAIRRRDATWHRPTWPFGASARPGAANGRDSASDPADPPRAKPPPRPSPERRRALASLGLAGDPSPREVKARYKALAKRHHPDANGGCKRAEERLKTINEAYGLLRGGEDV